MIRNYVAVISFLETLLVVSWVNVWLLEAEEAVVIVGGIMGIFAFLEL